MLIVFVLLVLLVVCVLVGLFLLFPVCCAFAVMLTYELVNSISFYELHFMLCYYY